MAQRIDIDIDGFWYISEITKGEKVTFLLEGANDDSVRIEAPMNWTSFSVPEAWTAVDIISTFGEASLFDGGEYEIIPYDEKKVREEELREAREETIDERR